MFFRLQHEGRRAFACHKAIAIDGEGATGMGRIVGSRREGSHAAKGRHRQHRHHRLGAAGDDHIGLAPLQIMKAFDDGIVP